MIELTFLGDEKDDNEEQGKKVSDREILNVFRRSDERVLKTAEIADELTIGQAWTGKRLERLKSESRVHVKSAGSKARVWWLDENEVKRPVSDGFGDVMWYRSKSRKASDVFYLIAFGLYGSSGILLIPYLLFDAYPSLQSSVLSTDIMSSSAFLGARIASLSLIIASVLHLIVLAIDRIGT